MTGWLIGYGAVLLLYFIWSGLSFLLQNKLAGQEDTVKSSLILFVIGNYSLTLLSLSIK